MGLLILLWVGWCVLHSLLITTAVRRWCERQGGWWQGGYRLAYAVISLVTVLPVVWYGQSLPQTALFDPPLWFRLVQVLLLVIALVLFVGGARAHDLGGFLGLRQWRDYRAGRPAELPALHTGGILAHVRHPWYGGGLALLWGLPGLTDVSLVTRLILSAYLLIGARLEERKLIGLHGEAYRDYRRRVPMFFPWRFGR